jgi:hypothetical protein
MPTIHNNVSTTSAAIAPVGMSSVATPAFVVKHQFGQTVYNNVTIYQNSTPIVVSVASFTSVLASS